MNYGFRNNKLKENKVTSEFWAFWGDDFAFFETGDEDDTGWSAITCCSSSIIFRFGILIIFEEKNGRELFKLIFQIYN